MKCWLSEKMQASKMLCFILSVSKYFFAIMAIHAENIFLDRKTSKPKASKYLRT